MPQQKSYPGFTIVELLIVIVIIAILAAITVVAYTGIQNRAQDTKRASDIANIEKALISYNTLYGGVKNTKNAASYTEGKNYSGWDSSVSPNWLAFLRPTNGSMPVDPKNTMTSTNNPPSAGNFNYYYFCYDKGTGPQPATANAALGYHQSNGTMVQKSIEVESCLP